MLLRQGNEIFCYVDVALSLHWYESYTNVPNKLGDLMKEMSKKCLKDTYLFMFAGYSKAEEIGIKKKLKICNLRHNNKEISQF